MTRPPLYIATGVLLMAGILLIELGAGNVDRQEASLYERIGGHRARRRSSGAFSRASATTIVSTFVSPKRTWTD